MADVPRFQRKTAFSVVGTNQAIGGGASAVIDYGTITFDLGDNFDLANNEYVAPLDGIYHFSMYVVCQFTNANTSRAHVQIEDAATSTELIRGSDMSYTGHAAGFVFSHWLSSVYHLVAGARIRFRALSIAGSPYNMLANQDFHYWGGYRIESESRTILGG